MAMARSTLRLIHSRDSTDDLLFRANTHLAHHEPDKALPLYTKVLYEKSPGHVCAFLNRSLAYIALGYPELATMDAYRAAISTDAARSTSSIMADTQLKTIARYFRAETLHKQSGDVWTTPPECYIGRGWLSSPLASIVILAENPSDVKRRQSLCQALELRALYRLVGALWGCGGGAVREALDFLSDVCKKYDLPPMAKHCFYDLGHQMLDEIAVMMEVDRSPHNSQGEPESTYWRNLETRATLVTREVYPWNTHEPEFRDSSMTEAVHHYVDSIARPCMPEFVQSFNGGVPSLRLVAARDIYPGEAVVSESSILQVTTESMAWSNKYFCDGCGATLVVPNEFLDKIFAAKLRSWSSRGASPSSSPTHKNTSYGDDPEERDIPVFSQQQKHPDSFPSPPRSPTLPKPPTPPPHQEPLVEPDFRLCQSCGEVAFCSEECQVQSSGYHNPLCTTWTESELREAYRNKRVWSSTINDPNNPLLGHHPKTHCIHDLLFVRLIALALETNTHPLDLTEILYLNGGLHPRPPLHPPPVPDDPLTSPAPPPEQPTGDRKSLPWSFESHVLRPLKYLARIGIDPNHAFAELAKYDGWVINTLFAKIEHSARITRGVRYVKVYDERGKLMKDAEEGRQKHRRGGDGDSEVWVGSLHPVLGMVGLADEERGELANVRVRDSEKGLECVAIPHASGTDVDVHVDIPADVTVLSEHQGRGLADAEMEMKGVLVPDAPPGRGRPAIRAGERILRSRREEQGGFAEAGEEGGNGGEEDGGVGAGGGPERRRIEVEEIMDVEEEEVEVGLEGEAEGGSQGMDLSA